jgi:hypothetical protein
MPRPDLATLACVNAECPLCQRAGAGTLVRRKVYGHDRMRLRRCRTGGEECSARRGPALFHTKLPEAKAEEVSRHLGEGCRVRATARLGKVAKETVARLWRVAGRQAERFHDRHVHDRTPKALECAEPWRGGKKSRSAARAMKPRWLALCGSTSRCRRTASAWCRSWGANAPMLRRWPSSQRRKTVFGRGRCRPFSPMPMPATSRLFWRCAAIVTRHRGQVVVR